MGNPLRDLNGKYHIRENWEYFEHMPCSRHCGDPTDHTHPQTKGEVDLLIADYDNRKLLLFEEKSTDNDRTRFKARDQLRRAYDYLLESRKAGWKIETYFLCRGRADRMTV